MSTVKTVTSESFNKEVLQSDVPVIVDFWAEWCGPCRMLAPVLDQLAEDWDGKAQLVKLNIDDHSDIASQYGIMSIPAVYLFKDGEVVATSIGVKPKAAFHNEFGDHIG